MLIKEMNTSDRPRERLLEIGPEKITNEELLAIILKTGSRGKSVKDLATELIEKLGGIENFKNLNLNNLKELKGIGKVKRIELIACLELGKRIYLNNY